MTEGQTIFVVLLDCLPACLVRAHWASYALTGLRALTLSIRPIHPQAGSFSVRIRYTHRSYCLLTVLSSSGLSTYFHPGPPQISNALHEASDPIWFAHVQCLAFLQLLVPVVSVHIEPLLEPIRPFLRHNTDPVARCRQDNESITKH